MIINLDKVKEKNKNITSDIMVGNFWDLDLSCHELDYTFPCCNHTRGINRLYNLGYVQGYMDYAIPFEAELYVNKENAVCMCVIMPAEYDIDTFLEEIFGPQEKTDNTVSPKIKDVANKVKPFCRKIELTDNSVLSIGMLDCGNANDFNVVFGYIILLAQMGLINFETSKVIASVSYLTDINGMNLVQITIILKRGGEVIATTPLHFRKFSSYEIIQKE